MKKGIVALIVILGLVGCQPSQENASTKPQELELTKSYGVNEEINFQIVKSEVSNQISPTNKNQTYKYINAGENNVFVDIVLKTTNTSNKEMKLEDIYSGEVVIDEQKYEIKQVLENSNYNQISTTDTLKSKETRNIHIYCEVSKTELKKEASLNMKVCEAIDYSYTFSTEETIIKNDIKSVGDTLKLGSSEISLKSMGQTKKLEPSEKGFFYSYIPTDNTDETFVSLCIELKNTTENVVNPSEYIYCEYQVKGETVKSQIIMESDNHKSISKTGDVPALATRTIYLAMPVKDNLLKESATIQLFVEGNTFEIQE